MKAIIFAAGLGTRLYPLTANKPKALVELNGKPLIYHAINKLKESGVTEIILNVHHFADLLIEYIAANDFGIPIHISDERNQLMDTGGGLFQAKEFLSGDQSFIAYNVDVISTVDLKKVIEFHEIHQPLATLVVRDRDTSRYFLFDNQQRLSGWKNISTGEIKQARVHFDEPIQMAFSGIQIISTNIFNLYHFVGNPFSLTTLYLELANKNSILGYYDTSDFWLDLGKTGQIQEAERWLKHKY